MKVLMINKFLYPNGGSETYIFKLGEALEKYGHEVQYFGMEHEGRCVGNRVNAYTSDMDFHSKSKLSLVSNALKTIYSKEAREKIRLVLDDFQPDVCHLNNFNYQLTPSIILEIVKWRKANHRQCKIIYTAHDYQLICPNHMLYNPNTKVVCEKCLGGHFFNCVKGKCIHGSTAKSLMGYFEAVYWNRINKVYHYIDKIICPSFFVKKMMDSNKDFSDKTVAIHNFIDFPVSDKPKTAEYVLYFGRYSEEKGVTTIIDVCKELKNIKFIFAGSGPLKDEISHIPNIIDVGFKNQEELADLIAGSAFCLCPSEWYEVFGLNIGEALKNKKRVIGSNMGAIPEQINSKNGLIVQPQDKEELEAAVLSLWEKRYENVNITDSSLEIKDYMVELFDAVGRGYKS